MKKILALLLMLALALSLAACGSDPVEAFKTNVQEGKFDEALKLYNEKIAGKQDKMQEATAYLNRYLEGSWKDYVNERISAEEFEKILTGLQTLNKAIGDSDANLRDISQRYARVSASRAAYQEGLEKMDDGDYEGAMIAFDRVIPDDEKYYNEARTQKKEATELYVAAIQEAVQEKLDAGDFSAALTLLDKAQRTVGSREEFTALRSRVATGKFETEMQALAEKNDYATMRAVYAEAQGNAYCVITDQMTQLFADQELQFRRDIIDRSIQAYRDGGYEAAIPVVAEGLAVLPEDEVFLDFEAKYKSCTPVSLRDVGILNGKYTDEFDYVTDIYGTRYGKGINFNNRGTKTWSVEFKLERRYARFQGICVPSLSENREVHIVVYVDDVKQFDQTLVQKTESIPFDIKVENANFLKIVVEFSAENWNYDILYLAEPILTRSLSEADLRNPLK